MALSMFKVIVLFFTGLLFTTANVSAQSAAQATVSATVTEVIGTITSTGITSVNLTVEPTEGTLNYRATGIGVAKSSVTRSVNLRGAASVTLVGDHYSYAVTIPSSALLKRAGGNETIQADAFTVSSSALKENTLIMLDAIFTITALQPAGDYTVLEHVPVTVHYN